VPIQKLLTHSALCKKFELPVVSFPIDDLVSVRSFYSKYLTKVLLGKSNSDQIGFLSGLHNLIKLSSPKEPISGKTKIEGLLGQLNSIIENNKEIADQIVEKITKSNFIHYLWVIDLVQDSADRIGVAKALLEIPSLVESLLEVRCSFHV
jgi:hypothetical protein